MPETTHHRTVDQQFGSQAQAYITSTVHAQGADLRHLAEILEQSPVRRALDLGCGGGHVAYAISPFAKEVVAYDLSQNMLDAVAGEAHRRDCKNITTRRGTAESMPFEDASFDFICTRYSAHHWRDLQAGLREARRVLRPGGKIVCIDIVSPEDPLYATFLQAVEILRDPSHVRDYSESEWLEALHEAGFEIHSITRDKLSMSFQAWIARMKPPAVHVDAVASLCRSVAPEVVAYFMLDQNDRFDMDMIMLEAA